ncbi:hypothetical protein Ssi03_62520 [Sphaerisporangium siamense]|nr:hypothetical protein Ssi03_62520 [Sphaerisporangium siamense]
MDAWTVAEAAEQLDPHMCPEEIRAMIAVLGIKPCGSRRTGTRGRPCPTYDATALQVAHAVVMRGRVDLGTFSAA